MSNLYPDGRKAWPDRILYNAGGCFIFGGMLGSAYHFLRGSYHSTAAPTTPPRLPSRPPQRPPRSPLPRRLRRPCLLLQRLHGLPPRKDDPWNLIFAGAVTDGFFELCRGLLPAIVSFVGCCVFFALQAARICYVSILLSFCPFLSYRCFLFILYLFSKYFLGYFC